MRTERGISLHNKTHTTTHSQQQTTSPPRFFVLAPASLVLSSVSSLLPPLSPPPPPNRINSSANQTDLHLQSRSVLRIMRGVLLLDNATFPPSHLSNGKIPTKRDIRRAKEARIVPPSTRETHTRTIHLLWTGAVEVKKLLHRVFEAAPQRNIAGLFLKIRHKTL